MTNLKDKIIVNNTDDKLLITLECNSTKTLIDTLKKIDPEFDVKVDLEEHRESCYDFIDSLNDTYITAIQQTMDIMSLIDAEKRAKEFDDKLNKENIET